ncbi:MAG TPA: hypothetical protein VK465_06990 [Fibrobacteria bacterium]|nr:hypothetical protein [Fibrobacteria bacterium]
MTRKTKSRRISLKEPQDKAFRQVWILREDHLEIPSIAKAIKAAHPGTDFPTIASVIHFCLTAAKKTVETQGA